MTSSRRQQHAPVARLIVGVVSVCVVGCGRGGGTGTSSPTNDDTHVSQPASVMPAARYDATRSPSFGALVVRALAKDVPEIATFEADVARAEQAAFTDLTAKVKALGPSASRETPARADPSSAALRAIVSASPPILLAGFGMGAAAPDAPAAPSGGQMGIGLGMLLTDMSDSGHGSSGGTQSAGSSENGVTGGMGIEFSTAANGSKTSSMTFEFSQTKDGATLSVKGTVKAEGDPCPDPAGTLALKYSITMRGDASAGGKQSGVQKEFTGSITAQVGDDAYASTVNVDARSQASAQRPASHNAYVDLALKLSQSGRWDDGSSRTFKGTTKVTRTGSTTTKEDVSEARAEAVDETIDIVAGYVEWLQMRWREGYCVTVVAPVPGSVKPGASTSIDVSVKQKRNGTEIHAPVDVTLQGKASIEPATIKPSPGTTTYVAPGEAGSHASLNFKSTSRRGIGTLDANVVVGRTGYDAKGGQNIAITGSVCGGVESPFTLHGRPPDGSSVTFSYSPSSATGGTYTYAGSGGGFTFSGKGVYTITKGANDTLRMRQADAGCMTNIAGGCASYVNIVTLTPADSCT